MKKVRKIRIRKEEFLKRINEGKKVFIDIFENEYYRPAETLYEVIYWETPNDDIRHSFATLKEAQTFAKKEYGNKPYEISRLEDKTSVGWNKKWWFEDGKVIDVQEQ